MPFPDPVAHRLQQDGLQMPATNRGAQAVQLSASSRQLLAQAAGPFTWTLSSLPCRRKLLLCAKHLLVIRNLLMRGLLLPGVAALSVLTASAAAHTETKEAHIILPDTITGNWCWVEGSDEKNFNRQRSNMIRRH
jgi:hypothetical protein